ncbi:MAG: hypothetical protein RIC29_12085 [Rhodospirillaceae bacterium]
MRNIFDQYQQPENRLSHALLTALKEDKALLIRFVQLVTGKVAPKRSLQITEQSVPGQLEPSENEKRGLPDGWIYSEDDWCILIESKVESDFSRSQLQRHRATAARCGFTQIFLVGITGFTDPKNTIELDKILSWKQIYAWLKASSQKSYWASQVASYFEVAEVKMSEGGQLKQSTLTEFTGIPFSADQQYSYGEGKRLLKLIMAELRASKALTQNLNVDSNAPGRTAITGTNEQRVWDYLSFNSPASRKAFTKSPHLTLGLHADTLSVMFTIPNSVAPNIRRNLCSLNKDGFEHLLARVVANMESMSTWDENIQPWFNGQQRHYKSQRSPPTIDAAIQFDLRTAIKVNLKADKKKIPVKYQPWWLDAAFGALTEKRESNYQVQIGALAPYDKVNVTRSNKCIDLIVDIWTACSPVIDEAFK